MQGLGPGRSGRASFKVRRVESRATHSTPELNTGKWKDGAKPAAEQGTLGNVTRSLDLSCLTYQREATPWGPPPPQSVTAGVTAPLKTHP